jgi:hypothetical protein
MKYCRVFEAESNYTDFINSSDYVTPNLCVIRSTGGTKCKPYIPPPPTLAVAGDVAYWDGSKVKTTPLSKWNTSLGTPVGVVVVPVGFAPDGKIRIISLKCVDAGGNQSNSNVSIPWGGFGVDTSLTNYTMVPITDNTGSTASASNDYGYLPSDKLTGTTSFVDPKAKYYMDSYLIPSPYLGDTPNPEYYKTISGNNVLSDFNGLNNTQTLVGLGSDYGAANAAWKYNDGSSDLQWYLPAMGELGYLLPRFNEINNTIAILGGVIIGNNNNFWSSSEYDTYYAYFFETTNNCAYYTYRIGGLSVRPFAILDDGEDSVDLITFTVNGAKYQAKEGMTWEEFINSAYNKYGYFATYFDSVRYNDKVIVKGNNSTVYPTHLIVKNGSYTIKSSGGAD